MTAKKKTGGPSPQKARKILKHGEVHGKPLTKKQKGYLGARAGGKPVNGKKR